MKMTLLDITEVPIGAMFEWDDKLWLRIEHRTGPMCRAFRDVGSDVVFVLEVDTCVVDFFIVPEEVLLIEG